VYLQMQQLLTDREHLGPTLRGLADCHM